MAKHVYVAPRASGFNFTVVYMDAKDKEVRYRVKFEKGQFETDDDTIAAAIDDQLANNIGISRNCRKADRDAAEALARQHAALNARTGAVKGGVTSEAVKHAMSTTLAEKEHEQRMQNADPAAFADENFQITEAAPAPAPQPQPDAPAPDATQKAPKATGIKLGNGG